MPCLLVGPGKRRELVRVCVLPSLGSTRLIYVCVCIFERGAWPPCFICVLVWSLFFGNVVPLESFLCPLLQRSCRSVFLFTSSSVARNTRRRPLFSFLYALSTLLHLLLTASTRTFMCLWVCVCASDSTYRQSSQSRWVRSVVPATQFRRLLRRFTVSTFIYLAEFLCVKNFLWNALFLENPRIIKS